MTNEYGLDVDYFSKWLARLGDISRYTPDELARELVRMSKTADESVLLEPEFIGSLQESYDAAMGVCVALQKDKHFLEVKNQTLVKEVLELKDRKHDVVSKMQVVIDAGLVELAGLKANNIKLRKFLGTLAEAVEYSFEPSGNDYIDASWSVDAMDLLDETPKQSLADHNAEVGKMVLELAIKEFSFSCYTDQGEYIKVCYESDLKEYAQQLKTGK